jgi:hypothetical protein
MRPIERRPTEMRQTEKFGGDEAGQEVWQKLI